MGHVRRAVNRAVAEMVSGGMRGRRGSGLGPRKNVGEGFDRHCGMSHLPTKDIPCRLVVFWPRSFSWSPIVPATAPLPLSHVFHDQRETCGVADLPRMN